MDIKVELNKLHELTNLASTLKDKRKIEKEKYELLFGVKKILYANNKMLPYGSKNHGKKFTSHVLSFNPKSILDIGCGRNNFKKWIKLKKLGIEIIGLDWASPEADIRSPLSKIPFDNESFDVVTAFDVLEHVLPEDIDKSLQEIFRIARLGVCFSISYKQSKLGVHPSVFPEKFWINKLSKYILVHVDQERRRGSSSCLYGYKLLEYYI